MAERTARAQPADKKERDYIVEKTDECLIVEAGAGTGKTTLLVGRIMSLLLKDDARLSDIAAITFTEKAAGELKVRLYEQLEKRLADGPGGAQEAKIRQALGDLETCQVSTIHAFAANLLRTRPVEAGVDPNFAVADENEMRLMKGEIWKNWLSLRLGEGDPLVELVTEFGAGSDNLRLLAKPLCENRDLLEERTPTATDTAVVERLLEAGERKLRDASVVLGGILSRLTPVPGEPSIDRIVKLVNSWNKYLRTSRKTDLAAALVIAATEDVKRHRRQNWPGTDDDYNEQFEVRLRLSSEAGEIVSEIGNALAPGVLGLILDYIKQVETEKEKRGLLDFQDLLIKTRDMLRGNKEARRYFQERFSHILVDEFQDTDPLQAEIVFFLAENGARAEEWSDVELEPGKLFIVGDPKQSIYRFRRADVEIYDKAKAAMGGKSRTSYIQQNFRSVGEIIDWVNETFAIAMRPPGDEAYQAEYKEILASIGKAGRPAVKLVQNREHEKETADIAREREAAMLAGSIEEMVSVGLAIRGKNGNKRPVRHSDICVLFRIMTNVHIYERAFREHGIPFRTEGGRNFFTRQEVLDIANAVRAIDNPYDQVSLAGALRSPLFAVPDSELALFASGGGRFNYLSPAGDGAIGDAFRILSRLHEGKDLRPIATSLEQLLDETKAREIYVVLGSSEQTLANFAKILEEARGLEASEGITFAGFARWLSEMEQENVIAGESPTEETGEDFVHFMSIHKAKGLEFPVVFLAGIGAGPKPGSVQLLVRHSTGQIEFKMGQIATEGFERLSGWSAQSDLAEECRVFYVSTTRARDILVMHDFDSKGSSSWFKPIIDDTGARGASEQIEESFNLGSVDIDYSEPERAAGIEEGPGPDLEEEERAWKEALNEAFRLGEGGPATRTATEAEGTITPPEEAFWPGVEVGKPVGSALHTIMETIEPGAGPLEREHLVRAVARAEGVADHEEHLLHMVNNVFSSDLWERATGSRFSSREMPFCVKDDSGYMVGKVDLVFVEEDGPVIVDYKSDNVAAGETGSRLEFYREQGEFYKSALGRVMGCPVKDVVFFFATPGVERTLGSGR